MLLFVADYVFSSAQKEQIIVDQNSIDFLINQREDLELRSLSDEEKRETVEGTPVTSTEGDTPVNALQDNIAK